MRRGMRPQWVLSDGKLVGIDLSADYTGEHEFGIASLKRMLGISDDAKHPGLPRRMVTKNDKVKLYDSGTAAALICKDCSWHEAFQEYVNKFGETKAFKERLPDDLRYSHVFAAVSEISVALETAWSESDFGIYGMGADADNIRDLAQAFSEFKVAVWLGGGGVFQNAGLVIAWADRIPKEGTDQLRQGDEDREKLIEASEKTGILKRLKAAGRCYFACTPGWNDGDRKSDHPVMYFLNPMKQDVYNFGWFTVEELDQWIAGTGPIPKADVKRNA